MRIYGFETKTAEAKMIENEDELLIHIKDGDKFYGLAINNTAKVVVTIIDRDMTKEKVEVEVLKDQDTENIAFQAYNLFFFLRDKYFVGRPEPFFIDKQLQKWIKR